MRPPPGQLTPITVLSSTVIYGEARFFLVAVSLTVRSSKKLLS
jgi:hypothetical protein